ncbi:MAG: hypothetical protein LC749_03970 [Actinobacteria bacterium]|nr:hypothetical protein [Actinomycetota bacterium]
MSKQSASNAVPDRAEYVVVLRARSAARFLPEAGCELVLNVPNLDLEGVRVRTSTRWVEESGKELPRELIIEVRGHAGSLDEAAAKFSIIARPIATMADFVANVRMGPLEVHLATCLGLAISAPSADLVSTALAELGTAVLSGEHPTARGWSISSWLVAHASGLAVDRVTFDGRAWTIGSGAWSQTGPADGVLSRHHAGSAA